MEEEKILLQIRELRCRLGRLEGRFAGLSDVLLSACLTLGNRVPDLDEEEEELKEEK